MVTRKTFKSRDEWLAARKGMIGGSDAACILGLNPWKSNLDLYLEKIGEKPAEEISNNALVKYGTDAEQHLRALYELDFPEYKMEYQEDNMWLNDMYPWAHASLDGWLIDKNGRVGIWECKTSTVNSSVQFEKWNGSIPNNYYCQVLHYLLVTEFEFVELKAQLKRQFNNELYITTKHYHIERKDVENDLKTLLDAEREFAERLKNKQAPALILPNI